MMVVDSPGWKDVLDVAFRLCPADQAEAEALGYADPRVACAVSALRSEILWSARLDGRACALWGVGPGPDPDVGAPWLLAAAEFFEAGLRIARASRRFIVVMNERFSILENFVSVDNATAIRWIEWMGFDLSGPVPHGPRGRWFYKFRRGHVLRTGD
ncbi:MAG: hypothetical protein PHV85_00500 [Desulfovibrionaceae bacterium]|nr:hypothetical protein [Desulfovibrionaceae bacterium]